MPNRTLTMRWMSGLLALLLWIGCTLPAKPASAAVVLPGMLTELGDEAFLGDYQVDGHVTLPSGMRTLGQDVFEGTRLYALTVPAGVDVIPAQSLSGAAYVRLLGAETSAEAGAFSGAAYVFGPTDSAARQQAAADGAVFLCTDTLVAQDGFWYLVEGGEATLICAVDNLRIGSSVQVPAALEDGTPVTALASTATLRLRPVTKLELPHGIREESGCFDGCPDAVISYYGDTFCVTSLRANRSSVSVGAEVIWIASTNSTGAVEYYFEVNQVTQSSLTLISRSDGFRSSLLYEDSNMHAVVLDKPGVYVARVVCRNEEGTEVSAESEAVVVYNHRLTVTSVTSDVLAGAVGCSVTWTATTEGGNGELRYHWQLFRDGEIIADLPDSDSPVYTLTGAEAGEYSVRLSVSDDLTETTVVRAEKVCVFTPAQAAPEAPRWTDTPFASAETDAPALEAKGLTISWESVEYAAQYGVILSLQLNGEWTEIVHHCISGNRNTAVIPASALADVTADTPCRISLYSINLEAGTPQHYYAILQPHVVDESLTIGGGYTSRLWYEAYYGAATRTFTVESELPWTVTAQNGAAWVSWQQDDGALVVSITENDTTSRRDEKLTISNGVNTATITLRHYVEHVPPQIVMPSCSNDSHVPTLLPMEPFELTIARNGNYNMYLLISQQNEDGTFTTLVRAADVGESYVVDPAAIGLIPGRTVRFSLFGYYDTYSNTVNKAALSDQLYVVLEAVDTAPMVGLPSGSTKAELVMAETEMTLPITFTGTMPTVTSDADWLSGTIDAAAKVLRITGSVNASSEARIGMLTLTNGSSTVLISVSQSAHLPEVLAPLALSETEDGRTQLRIQSAIGAMTLLVRGEQVVLYNTETAETVFTATNSTSEPFTVSIALDDVETSDTHTLTVTGHGMERVYYCYFSKNTSKVYFADGSEYASAAVPASGGSVNTTFTANSSWTVQTEADWLTLSVSSGYSVTDQPLTVTAAANDAGMPREADVIITRGNVRATLHITQDAGVAIATLASASGNPASLAVPGYRDDRAVEIAASGSWMLTSDVDWLFFNSARTQTSVNGSGSDNVDVYGADYYGTEPRSGSLVLTCGDQRVTLPVVQYPYSTFIIMQPDLSEETVNTLTHGNLTFTWAVDDAWIDAYMLTLSVPVDETGFMRTSEYVIPANGTGSYTFTLPASLCVPDTGKTCYVQLEATNAAMQQAMLFSADFLLVSDAAVLVDARPHVIHSNVSDCGDTFTHTITSEGTWTATSSAPWLTVSSASGESGTVLTVTAAANYGPARTGVVTLRCGSDTAAITVEQYQALTPYPTLNGEGLSTSIRSPMLIPASTTALTFPYNVEPAASKYVFELWEIEEMRLIGTVDEVEAPVTADDDCLNRMIRRSSISADNENAGILNLSGLPLQPGHLYCLKVERTTADSRGPVRTAYWFYTGSGSEAHLYIDKNQTNAALQFDAEGGYQEYKITSGDTWYATTNVDWIMLYRNPLDAEDLAEEGTYPGDYNSFVSTGEMLYISALPNTGDTDRSGVVTLHRFGGSETATITVTQPRYYTAAALISPALGSDASNPVVLPCEDITFTWMGSEDGTGQYTLKILVKEGRSYYGEWNRTTTALSLTPPASIYKPGALYRAQLDTWVEGGGKITQTYDFRIAYENELSLVADVDWQRDVVEVSAQATGGSGSGYQYAFILYCNGEIVDSVPWDTARNSTAFTLNKAGLWQVEVWVKDGQGQQQRAIVSERTLNEAALPSYVRLSGSNWLAPVEGGSMSIMVYASDEWQCVSGADWLHASSSSGSTGSITVTAFANDTGTGRSATLTFTCGTEHVVFNVTQQAQEMSADASISLNLTQWMMADSRAATIPLAVSATADWLISACPDWIIPSAVSGSGDSMITLYCEPNRGAGRNGTVTFLCGTAAAEMAVSQPSANREPATAAFTMNLTTVATGVPVTFTVTAQNATDVVLMVDGEKLESYSLTDGAATFTRAFSTEGTRSVQLVPMNGSVAGVTTEPQELTVFSKGKLASPVLNAIDPVVLGAGATVSWAAVPHAESYTADLYLGTVKIATQTMTADVTSVTFSADKLVNVGQYTLVVLATAAGYSQSETGMFVDVFYPQVNFSIVSPLASYVYVPADTIDIQVENPSGYYIAVKVTDEHGNVTYLPENRGTVSDTFIQGVLQYAPVDAGKITIQAMAYPTALRGSDEDAWFDASHNVTCTVNGPIVSRILINGEMGAVRMSDDMQTMTVTANNGVDTICVELDGQPLGVIKNGVTTTDPIPYDSEVNFVRTFSCTLPAATEGFHAYAVIGTDADGRTHKLAYRFYVVEPCEEFTVYAQTREDVILSLPSDSADDADGVSMIQPLTVVGSCGNMYYILYERTYALFFKEMAYGFIPKAQAGTEQKLDTEYGNIYCYSPISAQYSYIGAEDAIMFRWAPAGIDMPDAAEYHVYYRMVGETTWRLIGTTREKSLRFDISDLGIGEYEFAVTVSYNGTNSHHNEFVGHLIIFKTATECAEAKYENTESGGFNALTAAVCIGASDALYVGRVYLTNGVRDEVYLSAAKLYDILGENSVLDSSVGAQYRMVTGILEQLAVTNPDQSVGWLDSVFRFVDALDNAAFATSFLDKLMTEAKYEDATLKKIAFWLTTNNPKEVFADGNKIHREVTYLGNAMINFVRYDLIPDEDLLLVADCLSRSPDPNMQAVARMLRKLTTPDGLAAFVISGCGLEVADMIEAAGTDWFISLLSSTPVSKVLVSGAFIITEDLLNTSEINRAAYLCNANLDVLESYIPVYQNALHNFEYDPLTYYEEFVAASTTYYMILQLTHESLLAWMDVESEAVVNKVLDIFDHHYTDQQEAIKRNRDNIISRASTIDTALEALYDEVLRHFGIPHVDFVMPK